MTKMHPVASGVPRNAGVGTGGETRAGPLDNRIPPPIVTVLIGLAMGGASLIAPTVDMSPGMRWGSVGLVGILGGVFGARAFAAFAKARTTVNPVDIGSASALVTTGIYGISRNPMYVGLASLLVVLALSLSNVWLLLGPLIFVIFTTRFQIVPEERAMLAKFGADYSAYRRRVRRWL